MQNSYRDENQPENHSHASCCRLPSNMQNMHNLNSCKSLNYTSTVYSGSCTMLINRLCVLQEPSPANLKKTTLLFPEASSIKLKVVFPKRRDMRTHLQSSSGIRSPTSPVVLHSQTCPFWPISLSDSIDSRSQLTVMEVGDFSVNQTGGSTKNVEIQDKTHQAS